MCRSKLTLTILIIAASAGCDSGEDSAAVGRPTATVTTAVTEGQAPAAVIEPQADQALRSMCQVLEAAKAFQVRVTAQVDERSADGQGVQVQRDSTVLVRKPDALAAQIRSGDGQWVLKYKSPSLSVLREDRNQYATIQAPATIGAMLDFLHDEHGLEMPLADLAFPDPYSVLTENVQTGVYVGRHSVGERPCHHLLFTQEKVNWQIWIDAGATPLPLKIVITRTNEPGHPQYVAELSNWDLSPAAPDSAFEFKPPSGAEAVDMTALLGEKGR